MKKLYITATAVTLLSCVFTHTVAAQEIARLYAPKAPKGSSYIRVINPLNTSVNVQIANNTSTLDGQHDIATNYRVVPASAPVVIKVNGKDLPAMSIKPDSYNTIILTSASSSQVVVDNTDNANDLKAELRFYNTVPNCSANLAIANNGPVIFKDIAQYQSNKRAINPVKADVTGSCNAGTSSAAVSLPQIKAGDKASIFLLGDQQHARVFVQIDHTDPYTE